MNILVVLHAVRDPAGFVVNRKAQKIFVNREAHVINPADRNALELALRLADGGGQVIAFALGGGEADDVLRQARALGASRALLARDEALRPARADALVLAGVLRRLVDFLGGLDAVVLGGETLDADLAQVAPRLAAALAWPFVEAAHHAEPGASSSLRLITQAAGGGPGPTAFRQFEVSLPAVISVARDSNKPRYAPAAQLVTAFRAKDAVEAITALDLQLAESDLQAAVRVRAESFPAERTLGTRAEGSLDEIANQLASEMRKS